MESPSRFVDRTKEMWTPRLRWFEEQSRHKYTPKGTEDQVGFFWPQSKHICRSLDAWETCRGLASYFVRLFGLELLEDLLRLRFGGAHRGKRSDNMHKRQVGNTRSPEARESQGHMFTKNPVGNRVAFGKAALACFSKAGPKQPPSHAFQLPPRPRAVPSSLPEPLPSLSRTASVH